MRRRFHMKSKTYERMSFAGQTRVTRDSETAPLAAVRLIRPAPVHSSVEEAVGRLRDLRQGPMAVNDMSTRCRAVRALEVRRG